MEIINLYDSNVMFHGNVCVCVCVRACVYTNNIIVMVKHITTPFFPVKDCSI